MFVKAIVSHSTTFFYVMASLLTDGSAGPVEGCSDVAVAVWLTIALLSHLLCNGTSIVYMLLCSVSDIRD